MIIGAAVALMIAAHVAYITLFLIGDVGSFAPPDGVVQRLAYHLVSTSVTTGIGCLLLLLLGLGLVKFSPLRRPCPKVVILILIIWITLVWGGWRWAYGIDNKVDDFFGEGSVLAEIADDRLGFPQDEPIPDLSDNIWQVTSIDNKGNEYCALLQYYTWGKIPTHRWMSCFSIVLNDAPFFPKTIGAGIGVDETNGMRPQDRFFHTGGTPRNWTDIEGLAWRNGRLTLTLSPYNPLTDLVLEVIDYWAYDGKKIPDNAPIILTLFPSNAATDKETGTLTWAVEEQPWKFGDRLTLRIRAQRLPPAPP